MVPARLTFLGTGDSKSVPRFWCACPVCTAARQTGRGRRTRTAMLLQGGGETALLDVGTDLQEQLSRFPAPLHPSHVFISHAHNDHLLGLADVLDYRALGNPEVKIYTPAAVLPEVRERFAYAFRAGGGPVQPLPPEGCLVAGLRLQLFPVPHGANGSSHAYLLERPGFRAAIITDALDIPLEVVRAWQLHRLDLLILGTSFVDESPLSPRSTRSVYDTREALALPWAQAAGRVILTHLSHDVDVRRVPLPQGWSFAQEGQGVDLA